MANTVKQALTLGYAILEDYSDILDVIFDMILKGKNMKPNVATWQAAVDAIDTLNTAWDTYIEALA